MLGSFGVNLGIKTRYWWAQNFGSLYCVVGGTLHHLHSSLPVAQCFQLGYLTYVDCIVTVRLSKFESVPLMCTHIDICWIVCVELKIMEMQAVFQQHYYQKSINIVCKVPSKHQHHSINYCIICSPCNITSHSGAQQEALSFSSIQFYFFSTNSFITCKQTYCTLYSFCVHFPHFPLNNDSV